MTISSVLLRLSTSRHTYIELPWVQYAQTVWKHKNDIQQGNKGVAIKLMTAIEKPYEYLCRNVSRNRTKMIDTNADVGGYFFYCSVYSRGCF